MRAIKIGISIKGILRLGTKCSVIQKLGALFARRKQGELDLKQTATVGARKRKVRQKVKSRYMREKKKWAKREGNNVEEYESSDEDMTGVGARKHRDWAKHEFKVKVREAKEARRGDAKPMKVNNDQKAAHENKVANEEKQSGEKAQDAYDEDEGTKEVEKKPRKSMETTTALPILTNRLLLQDALQG